MKLAAVEDTLSAVHSLSNYLEISALRFPERLAAIDPDGTALTYRELDERANRIAGFLVQQGVRAGDRVGLVLPKSTAALTSLFGIMKAGAAYVPVDWKAPAERIRTILNDCQVRALFLDSSRPELADIAETVICFGEYKSAGCSPSIFTWDEVMQRAPEKINAAARNSDDLAYILYTSGSTGIPKGVMLTHRNAISYVDWCSEIFRPTENDRFSSHAPFHFDLSILDIYVPIKHGASVHLIPDELGKNPNDLARFIANRQLTVWYSTPAILSLLAEFGNLERHRDWQPRLVLFAGEVFPVKQLRRLASYWADPVYYNLYGPTETNVCTFARIQTPIPSERMEPYPIGWPCSHCASLVVDSEGTPVTPEKEGLLCISGPSVFSGYWNRPKETSAAFLEHNGIHWYNTGDVVKQDGSDGLIYVGRRDRMIKRRGYRIELDDVQTCLYRHSAISDVAVVAVAHAELGMRIIAYLAAPEDTRPSIVELKRFCNQHLPAYMNPDIFIFINALPRLSTNKVDYQALVSRFEMAESTPGRAASAGEIIRSALT